MAVGRDSKCWGPAHAQASARTICRWFQVSNRFPNARREAFLIGINGGRETISQFVLHHTTRAARQKVRVMKTRLEDGTERRGVKYLWLDSLKLYAVFMFIREWLIILAHLYVFSQRFLLKSLTSSCIGTDKVLLGCAVGLKVELKQVN